jgi:hypothetical protein
MLAENGARFVFNELPAGSATVFPKGAIHFEMNLECGEFFQPRPYLFDPQRKEKMAAEPTLFVAAFNNEDPGVLQLAQRCAAKLLILSLID